jgi:hypothetical protein
MLRGVNLAADSHLRGARNLGLREPRSAPAQITLAPDDALVRARLRRPRRRVARQREHDDDTTPAADWGYALTCGRRPGQALRLLLGELNRGRRTHKGRAPKRRSSSKKRSRDLCNSVYILADHSDRRRLPGRWVLPPAARSAESRADVSRRRRVERPAHRQRRWVKKSTAPHMDITPATTALARKSSRTATPGRRRLGLASEPRSGRRVARIRCQWQRRTALIVVPDADLVVVLTGATTCRRHLGTLASHHVADQIIPAIQR